MQKSTRTLLDTIAKSVGTPVEEARALAAEAYTSEDLYALELERIFRREWICVGREDHLPNPGDYRTVELAGEPLVIVRDAEGALRVLSNVCRHRYMQLVEGQGNTERFVCPYHGWTYQLDGKLAGAPHMTESRIFERRTCQLPEFRLETWLGFVFVNLDPRASPLGPQLAEAAERLAPYGVREMRSSAICDEIWEGNWKLAMENGMESYHDMGLHAETVEPWMPTAGSYFDVAREAWNCHRTPFHLDKILEDMPSFGETVRRFSEGVQEPDRSEVAVYSIYPALDFDQLPGYCIWLCFLPLGVARTRVLAGTCVPAQMLEEGGEALRREHQATQDGFNVEDSQATWMLQRQFGSRVAAAGPLSVKEEPLLHFQRYLAQRLAGAG